MPKITRATQQIFGSSAPSTQITAFGTAMTNDPNYTKDVSQIMNASYKTGWAAAIEADKAPYEEDTNGLFYAITRQLAYLFQSGVAEWDSNTTYFTGDFCKGMSDGKLYVSKTDDNTNNDISNTTYWEEFKSGGSSRQIGEIITSTIPLEDAGLHLLDGSLLVYGIYKDFIDYIASLYTSGNYTNIFATEAQWQAVVSQYGVCGKFVYNSTNNTVRLPKITGFIEGASGVSTLGNLTEAGLPNITGHFISVDDNRTNPEYVTGAFYVDNNRVGSDAGDREDAGIGFDASRSSSIYGNSPTVQPQSIKVLYYIVVATSTKTSIQVDIDEIATDLNGKADVDLSNTNNTAKIMMSRMGMPSDTYVDLTLGASGSTYTAPADGWFYISKQGTAAGQQLVMGVKDTNNSTIYDITCVTVTSANAVSGILPVKKSDRVEITYQTPGQLYGFRFVYAKGSESEA